MSVIDGTRKASLWFSMGKKSFEIGRRFEYSVRDHLKEQGYIVLRAPASKGEFDLIAVGHGAVLLVQCKVNGICPPAQWNALYTLAESVRGIKCLPIIVFRLKRKKHWRQIVALKDGTVRRQPWIGIWLFGNDHIRAVQNA